jgi:hypothetical protein
LTCGPESGIPYRVCYYGIPKKLDIESPQGGIMDAKQEVRAKGLECAIALLNAMRDPTKPQAMDLESIEKMADRFVGYITKA